MTDSTVDDNTPVSRDTIKEISAMWDSIKEIMPGKGEMPASLQDFTSAKADAQVIDDSSQAFDRLIGINERKQSLSNLWMDNDYVAGGALLVGTAALLYSMYTGLGPPAPSGETFGDSLSRDPIQGSIILGIGAGTVGVAAMNILDRGYASFKGLGDALNRLDDGAIPYADSLRDRLSDSEVDTYSDILRLGYEVSAGSDEITQQQLLEQIRKTTMTITDKLEGTPQAGMIQEVLDSLHDSLAASVPSSAPDMEPNHAAMDNNTPSSSSPGL